MARPLARYERDWAHEIEEILERGGYANARAHAERLVRDGYGPTEIERRVRTGNLERELRVPKLRRHGNWSASGDVRKDIVASMARTLFVDAWASRQEEKRGFRGFGAGVDIMDIAPKTNAAARRAAADLAARIESMNGRSLPDLYQQAESTPGRHARTPTPQRFGHYLAMQSLGHGVSWFDDHPSFPLRLPHFEFYL